VAPELVERYRAEGFWTGDTLGTVLAAALTDRPDLAFTVRSERRPYRGTFAGVADLARRVAGGLRARGIERGDLVAFQLPNWVEAAATFWGIAYLGAVPVPIVHFYGAKEVGFILRQSGARVLITADHFGAQDFLANLEALRPTLDSLELVAVVGDDTALPDDAIHFDRLVEGDPVDAPVADDAAKPALIAYTSGTTSDPKGVVHAHRTIVSEIRQLSAMQAKGSLPYLVGAPVGHGIGMLAALLMPVYRRDPIHLIDVWDPARVLAGMLEEGVSAGAGATYFLTSLLDHPDYSDAHRELMPFMGLGGSSVPSAVTERCEAMGIRIVRSYGSTEHPSISGAVADRDPRDKRLYTDGAPMPGVEVELRDDDGKPVPTGEPGEINSRGPDLFPGYTDPQLTADSFDAGGWFATGDIGVLDDDGYLAIVDRKKDIIIRGGENVSALEIEEQLLRMPGVAEVAVVAAPDPRLGEHGCAFFRLLPDGELPSLEKVQAHLDQAGLAKQKWPEELRAIVDFPRTPSGKVQKYALRDRLRTEAGA
jgi:acyl-CoA synthetase (AMP-forming)/AMP-acid ligase II